MVSQVSWSYFIDMHYLSVRKRWKHRFGCWKRSRLVKRSPGRHEPRCERGGHHRGSKVTRLWRGHTPSFCLIITNHLSFNKIVYESNSCEPYTRTFQNTFQMYFTCDVKRVSLYCFSDLVYVLYGWLILFIVFILFFREIQIEYCGWRLSTCHF